MNFISSELSEEKDLIINVLNEDEESKHRNSFITICKKIYNFCEAYGGVFGYYGSVLGVIVPALLSPIINSFQGGCGYPYVSEVTRDGFGKALFIIGSLVAGIPWIIFSFSYFRVFSQFSLQISSLKQRTFFQFTQYVSLVFNILSALGMICTACFDMGHFPLTHEYSVATFAVPLNLLAIINIIHMRVYGKRKGSYFIVKMLTICCSFGGILAFTLLGMIKNCTSLTLLLETCLRETTEDICFNNINKHMDGYTYIRHYPRCQRMHFWRGWIEYVALLSSAQLILFLYHDRNYMQQLVTEHFNTYSSNPFILKEIKEQQVLIKEEERELVM